MHGCAETRTSFWRNSLICSASFPPLFWQVRPQGGTFPQHRVWDRGREGRGITLPPTFPRSPLPRQYYSCSNGIVQILNDVESFKTNSVLCVWWLNDMDFPHCGLWWEEGCSLRAERVWWILRWVIHNSNYNPTYFTLVQALIWVHDKLGNYNNKIVPSAETKRHLSFFIYGSLTWTMRRLTSQQLFLLGWFSMCLRSFTPFPSLAVSVSYSTF